MKTKIKIILAIHCTDNYFGFAYKETTNKKSYEDFFIRKIDKNISNNLVDDLNEFLSKKSFHSIERISVSKGPSNFNASRLVIVLARTLSQQLNCSLDSYSSFYIMAKRIALENKVYKKSETFWIINKLKNKGFIAGMYGIKRYKDAPQNLFINELQIPQIYKDINSFKFNYFVDFDIKKDLLELLNLSTLNSEKNIFNSWDNVLPIYPISPIN